MCTAPRCAQDGDGCLRYALRGTSRPKKDKFSNPCCGREQGKRKKKRDVRNAYVSMPLSAPEESSFCDVAFPSTDGGLFRYVSTTSMGRHKGVSGSPALPLEWVDL